MQGYTARMQLVSCVEKRMHADGERFQMHRRPMNLPFFNNAFILPSIVHKSGKSSYITHAELPILWNALLP